MSVDINSSSVGTLSKHNKALCRTQGNHALTCHQGSTSCPLCSSTPSVQHSAKLSRCSGWRMASPKRCWRHTLHPQRWAEWMSCQGCHCMLPGHCACKGWLYIYGLPLFIYNYYYSYVPMRNVYYVIMCVHAQIVRVVRHLTTHSIAHTSLYQYISWTGDSAGVK